MPKSKHSAVFLDMDSLDRDDIDRDVLTRVLPDWTFYGNTDATQLAQRLTGHTIVVSNKVVLDAALLQQSPQLQYICVAATGTNNIDLAAAAAAGIAVSNVTAYATDSVVEHVFMSMLMLVRNSKAYLNAIGHGDWQRSRFFSMLDYPLGTLSGRTLGIIGYGELGQAVAQRAAAFGMQVQVAQSFSGRQAQSRIALDQLLASSDIISLHCPLTEQTRQLIDAAALQKMKASAYLINTARGGTVDEAALLHALQHGELAGAAMDVLSEEPPINGNPLLAVNLPNLIITPHIAWAAREARQQLVAGVAANIEAFLHGELRNSVIAS